MQLARDSITKENGATLIGSLFQYPGSKHFHLLYLRKSIGYQPFNENKIKYLLELFLIGVSHPKPRGIYVDITNENVYYKINFV
jgi:hypothetical protein